MIKLSPVVNWSKCYLYCSSDCFNDFSDAKAFAFYLHLEIEGPDRLAYHKLF